MQFFPNNMVYFSIESCVRGYHIYKEIWNLNVKEQWPICTIGSCDTAGGQGPWNHHRKCMESADRAVQSHL